MVRAVSSERKYEKFESQVERCLRTALRKLKKQKSSVEVFLVSEKEIRKLNRTYRKKDKSTNVLSFEMPASFPSPDSKNKSLGEIFLAPDYIEKHGEDMEYMAIHGLLHLLGYDHITKRDRIEMESKEKALCHAPS